jgi:hypothetical protein
VSYAEISILAPVRQLHRRPAAARRYSDTAEIDAGRLTGIIAAAAVWIFRYRQRRWRKHTRHHLMPAGAPLHHPAADRARLTSPHGQPKRAAIASSAGV